MAHKLARLIYVMIKFGTEYVDKGMAAHESRYRQQQMKWLSKQAASLNLQLIPRTGSYRLSFWRLVVSTIGRSPLLLLLAGATR
jgi:hypothetical protein